MSQENVKPPEEEPVPLEVEDDQPISLEGQDDGPIKLDDEDDEPIALEETEGTGATKVKMLGAREALARKAEFKRPLNLNGTGATRFRMFRTKLAIASLEALEDQINEWLDSQEVEVKHVAQVIGTVQGKTPEPNLIVTVWY